jgi:methylmalonyl-CoA mutase
MNQIVSKPIEMHKPKNQIRIVTAASLFDGHDASINIIRRLLQENGAEVIHLGHNRSVADVVRTALQEGAQGICISSYQGGHMEYFKYAKDLLKAQGADYVQIFGGGGGVIVHDEKRELEAYGIARIFHPDEGRVLGLEGMINIILQKCDFDLVSASGMKPGVLENGNPIPSKEIGLAISAIESNVSTDSKLLNHFKSKKSPLVVGITGTGGAGKSSLIDELVQRFLNCYPDFKFAVLCVDPSKKKTGGALLGDRIRMNSLSRPRVFMRSMASRGSGKEISDDLPRAIQFCKTLDFDLVIAETSGIGQGGSAITEMSDISMYVMTSEFGSQSQLEKIDMIDFADLVAINKADRRGSKDALRDVSKQYRRSRKIFDQNQSVPVFLTQASMFNDLGVNQLFFALTEKLSGKNSGFSLSDQFKKSLLASEEHVIVPADRTNYLAEIVGSVRGYKQKIKSSAEVASKLGALEKLRSEVPNYEKLRGELESKLSSDDLLKLKNYESIKKSYDGDVLEFSVRDQKIKQPLKTVSLSGTQIKRVVVPNITDWGDRLRYMGLENVPGYFPYTAGVFPLKRTEEEPKRMFAGEGPPERTNKRFHYLCKGEKAHRLSTAFDSVTLYGQDPDNRPDIYGKVGESGVSVCSLQDMQRLYEGFDLCNPTTSVSMTINGPAPMILAFYFNTAIDQQVQKKQKSLGRNLTEAEYKQTEAETLAAVRGTVQADILKEDQGQNTCIFSINFALKMMGDIQEYFINNNIRNFYSVSISGYHIAEAGANPISQLAFTLSNGFTFVEYYRARGLKIDDFAANLSFFFSNGLDPEYSVLGRVARRIWAIAMRDLYKSNDRSQKLKYHIQTSGRSLHAQEISFNDIRTTLQALLALQDNCNSLHTNAFDEAITTPTEASVRQAMAIQMIINREYGVSKNENPQQGSYFIDELTDLVEEAVLDEFLRINERGGVLGAMETQYQRGKIQDESMHYEHLKHSGELPIIGVNTFIDPKTLQSDYVPPKIELARSSYQEKDLQLSRVNELKKSNQTKAQQELQFLKDEALAGRNIFAALMRASRYCSLYQMTQALFEVGGEYRRNV